MKRFALLIFLGLALLTAWARADERVPENRQEIALSFAPVVRDSAPAVVNIYASRVTAERTSPFAGDPFFSQFFRGLDRAMPRVQNSLGSGVILGEDGIVVSNYHVVGGASDIRVVLNDRREFGGTVLLADQKADIAVIRLDGASGLPALEFGDSDAVEVGDLVLAIGNPFGVGQTVSSGIVSGLARSGGNIGSREGYYIQTDAPINPGNSGGALVDMNGRLIGIATSILTRSGGSNGIGFAIPANLVREYIDQALEGREEFVKPWAGVSVQEVDGSLAEAMGMDAPAGVLIVESHPVSPFAQAGLEPGDVLLSLDGLPVNLPAELEYRLATRGIGAAAKVSYLRGGDVRTAIVRMEEAPDEPHAAPVLIETQSPLNGLLATDVNPRVIEELDLPLSAEGVIVLKVRGYAARLGLRPGDQLIAVNGKDVTDASRLVKLTSKRTNRWRIDFMRGGRQLSINVRF